MLWDGQVPRTESCNGSSLGEAGWAVGCSCDSDDVLERPWPYW